MNKQEFVTSVSSGGKQKNQMQGLIGSYARTDKYNPEKPRQYTVRVKGIDGRFNWLMYDRQFKKYVIGAFGSRSQNFFTEKQWRMCCIMTLLKLERQKNEY